MLAKFFACALLLSTLGFASAWKWGPCPSVTLQEDFDVTQYTGTWREAARMKGTWFQSGECGWANYTPLEGDCIRVENTQILPSGEVP